MSMRRCLVLPAVLVLALCAGGGAEGPLSWLRPVQAKEKPAAFPEHVVLIILGGGVRSADLADSALMPRLAAMGAAGCVVKKISSGAPDSYSAAMRILTGRRQEIDAARLPRPEHPTLCEYVRRDLDLPAEKVWFVSYEGEDHLHLAYSTDAAYGVACAPGIATGIGAFAHPLESFLEARGRPDPIEPGAWKVLRRLRRMSREARRSLLPRDLDAGLPRAERVERALLRELDRKRHPDLLALTHPLNPRDEQAIRAAQTVLAVHRPALTVVRLGEAARAVASYEAYRKVLAAADAGIGRLRDAVAADKLLAGKTSFLVLSDRGRNEKPDAAGRLDADDASRQRGFVRLVFVGPGLRRRGRVEGARSLDDVCPSIAHLLGVRTPSANGRIWAGLFNER